MKSTPVATASATLVNAPKPQRAAPAPAAIAQKACEIWLSEGQQAGCDQKHWLEAELQLKNG